MNIFKKKIFEGDYFLVSFCIVVIISTFFRFWNYSNRWGLAYDQAQFAVLARYALETMQLPLLGPFSSGGPFQTGGEWYWLVMAGTAFYPSSIISPWVFITFLTVISVVVMIFVGRVFESKTFGIILGAFIAVSPSQIHQSTNLTNQTPIVLFSALSLLFAGLYIRSKKSRYIFLLALMVGVGTSIHIQVVALIPFVILTYILFSKKYIREMLLIVLGILIPWVPVLISDSGNNFYNTYNMLSYFASDQAKTSYDVLGRRWLTFITIFTPTSWGQIIGGNIIFGYISVISIGLFSIFSVVKRRLSKELVLIILSSAIMFVVLRYIRTPLYESFFVFIHPFVIFLTGWVVYRAYKKFKILGIFLVIIILISSIYSFWSPINSATNNAYIYSGELQEFLYDTYPNENFYIYDYGYRNGSIALPLVLRLYMDGRTSEDGRAIGFFTYTKDDAIIWDIPPIHGELGSKQLYDISASDSATLLEMGWKRANPKRIYDATEHWFKEVDK